MSDEMIGNEINEDIVRGNWIAELMTKAEMG